ncbi:calmodulin-lysine N-methyltransferase [Ixodes scapularis]|uniref:Calmodulin-lysine N-methyltransferase n=2 Tax=Ixodes TaxID=6944 RepID=A0A0K8RJY8_IXORI|nr:calmodulin-lysine N-methyltransferase [Ixodes scapularis]
MAADIRKKVSKPSAPKGKFGSSVAMMRWRMLAKALHEGRISHADLFCASMRRFGAFRLLDITHIKSRKTDEDDDDDGMWFECVYPKKEPEFRLKIRALPDRISLTDIKGFDNTGNVCIWPSEEVLAYYCMKNKEVFVEKNVCELGGGMTCLAGFVVAVTTKAKEVYLTDGNSKSVQNVQVILDRNIGSWGKCNVVARRIRWDENEDIHNLTGRFDVIIAADCLFFDDGRVPLVNTIWKLLRDRGLALILAPKRGTTFQQFVDLALEKFEVEIIVSYDTYVWDLHDKFQRENRDTYIEDVHYPLLMLLRKIPES